MGGIGLLTGLEKNCKKEKAATDAACNCALLHEICALSCLRLDRAEQRAGTAYVKF